MSHRLLASCCLAILMAACGGSSGVNVAAGGDANPNDPNGSNPTGRMILSAVRRDQPLQVLDLSTGALSTLPGTDWSGQGRYHAGAGRFEAYPGTRGRFDDTLTTVVINNCVPTDPGTGLSAYEDCLDVQNISGAYVGGTLAFDTDIDQPTLSPNGQYIALYRKPGPSVSSNDSLVVLARDGSNIAGYNFDNALAHQAGFDWVDNSRLFFAAGSQLGILDIHSSDPPSSFSFPASYGTGDVWGVRVSPDGSSVMFFLGTRLLVMSIDGSNLRELVRGAGNRKIRHPVWSPDGERVAFLFGYVNNTGVPDVTLNNGFSAWRMVAINAARSETLVLNDDLQNLPTDARLIAIEIDGVVTEQWTREYEFVWKPD